MDGNRFDEYTKALATGVSRRQVIKALAGGALAAVFGARAAPAAEAAPTCRVLGESCRTDATCCSGQNLFCQQIGETGARRCECETGFTACGGVCVSISCPPGAQFNPATCSCACPSGTSACGGACLAACPTGQTRNPTTCACECPSGTELCGGSCVTLCTGGSVRNPTTCACECPAGTELCGGNCIAPCTGGQTRNPTTCACECGTGEVFCNGACHNVSTACAGCHNKVFNAQCCSCENPGQPSGKCKGTPCTDVCLC
jgi:hypothetical protein